MSIEDFHNGYPADDHFVRDMARRPEFGTISPVRFMAGIYIKEGSHGLSQASYVLAHRTDSGVRVTDRDVDAKLVRNASAVYFGNMLSSIEDMILEGHFDQEKFNSVILNSFTGSVFNPLIFNNPEDKELDDFEIHDITRVAVSDKTFASFFKDKYYVLPDSLKAFLDKSGMYPHIMKMILPEYTERVQMLISANAQKRGLN